MSLLLALALGIALGIEAQVMPVPPAAPQAAVTQDAGTDQPTYRLHTETRAVLTDVVVQDREGNPVQGLPRSAFHVTDNGREQRLTSFEEHNTAVERVTSGVHGPDAYSNDFLQPPPAVLNVLLLDTTSLEIADQMYLREELDHFVAALPEGTRLAVFSRAGEQVIVQQSFTTDRDLLARAIDRDPAPARPEPAGRDRPGHAGFYHGSP